MHEQTVPANCYIIREGDDGGHLYVGEGRYIYYPIKIGVGLRLIYIC